MRPEISLKVLKFNNENEKEEKVWDLLKIHKNEKNLIYVYRIESERGVKRLSEKALEKGYKSICFHGDMTAKERKEIISKYKNNDINIIFATNAFGMGIDIPDIRTVIHFMIPESVEQYYQEVGRAERDGKQPSVITKWLSGTHNFTTDTLDEIAYHLGIETAYLMQPQQVQIIYQKSIQVVTKIVEVERNDMYNFLGSNRFFLVNIQNTIK